MITTDELKVQLADYGTAVKDLEEALAIDASRKRVQELEHTMSRPGFYDDAELSKKVFDEVGDQVSVTLKYANVLLVKVVTHKLVKLSQSQLLKFLHLKLVKLLKTQLNNVKTPKILGVLIYTK